jgi:hypothetical protein
MLRLGHPNEGEDERVSAVQDLGKVGNGGYGDLAIKEEGGPCNGLPDEEPEGGKHGHVAVGHLG